MLSANRKPLGFTKPVAVVLMYAAGGTTIEDANEKAATLALVLLSRGTFLKVCP